METGANSKIIEKGNDYNYYYDLFGSMKFPFSINELILVLLEFNIAFPKT